MEIVAYRAEHFMAITAQEGQQHLARYMTPGHAKALEGTLAYTAILDGKPAACGGVIEHWPGRYEAWMHIADLGPRHFRALHQAVSRFLSAGPQGRIEAYVDAEFAPGHRWMKLLGFKEECARLEKYFPGGRDAVSYVRIR